MATKPIKYEFIYDEKNLKKAKNILVDYYVQIILKDKELLKKLLTPWSGVYFLVFTCYNIDKMDNLRWFHVIIKSTGIL